MPPVANPNPDRARRGASTGEAKDEIVPEPLLPVGAPAAAPIVASVAARAPAAAGVFGIMPSRGYFRCESVYLDECKQIHRNTRVSSPKSKYTKYRLPT